MERLIIIQQRLNAPKSMRNSFGNYNYRSCEGILEAVKPLLKETETTLIISDEVVEIGSRIYVKATAKLYEKQGSIIAQASAYAREEESKKGMDTAQITGATSSYARKYALNGLFAIDDCKDPDTDEYTKQQTKPQGAQKTSTDKNIQAAQENAAIAKKAGISDDVVLTAEERDALDGVYADIDSLTVEQFDQIAAIVEQYKNTKYNVFVRKHANDHLIKLGYKKTN